MIAMHSALSSDAIEKLEPSDRNRPERLRRQTRIRAQPGREPSGTLLIHTDSASQILSCGAALVDIFGGACRPCLRIFARGDATRGGPRTSIRHRARASSARPRPRVVR